MSFLDDIKKNAGETKMKQRDAKTRRREGRLQHINRQCKQIVASLRQDIENDARGKGSWKGHVMGFIHYWIEDTNGKHLKLEKNWDGISLADIEALPGIARVKEECAKLEVDLLLKEVDDEDASIEQNSSIVNVILEVKGWD